MELKESLNQKNKEKVAIGPVKLERAQIYINTELRKVLGWRTEEELTAIATRDLLLLFRIEEFTRINEALEKTFRKLKDIKKKFEDGV